MQPHPLGVQPLGQLWLEAGAQSCRGPGLGALGVLSDELLIGILSLCDAQSLCALVRAKHMSLININP